MEHHQAILVEDQEAEDAVGIEAYKYDNYDDYIIGAIDKDMLMISGTHYNYRTGDIAPMAPVEAMRKFMVQLVTGDSTDNIPGIYKQLMTAGEEEAAHKFRHSR